MRLRLLVVLASSFSLNTTDHHQKYSYCVALGADQREWVRNEEFVHWMISQTNCWPPNSEMKMERQWMCISLSVSLFLSSCATISIWVVFAVRTFTGHFFHVLLCVLVSGLYTHFVWSMGNRDNQKRFVHKIFQAKKWFMPFSRVSPFLLSNCSYAAAVNPHGERTMPICTYSMSIQIYNRKKENEWQRKMEPQNIALQAEACSDRPNKQTKDIQRLQLQ